MPGECCLYFSRCYTTVVSSNMNHLQTSWNFSDIYWSITNVMVTFKAAFERGLSSLFSPCAHPHGLSLPTLERLHTSVSWMNICTSSRMWKSSWASWEVAQSSFLEECAPLLLVYQKENGRLKNNWRENYNVFSISHQLIAFKVTAELWNSDSVSMMFSDWKPPYSHFN